MDISASISSSHPLTSVYLHHSTDGSDQPPASISLVSGQWKASIGPIVEELAEKYKGKVKFVKCNVDENPSTPVTYEVRAIPTLLFVKGGSVVKTITGMTTRVKLEETIETML